VKPQELRSARLAKGWTQTKAAARLGVTQAYLNFLENGKRRLTPGLVRRATWVYGLSPEALPLPSGFAPRPVENRRLAEWLASLGYPGSSYLRTNTPRKNPAEVLLTALWQKDLDGRVAEALPWVTFRYAHADPWLVENARRFNLQNRLGFVGRLARRLAEKRSKGSRLATLRQLEHALDESRLVKEDVFYRPPRTESEREWLRQHRTKDAAHWNLLTDMKPEHLQYAR
jgi:transcriptional regulator with XRE-family HTH domain